MTTINNDIPDWRIEIPLWKVWKVITWKTPSIDNPEDWWEIVDFITPTDFKNDSKYLSSTTRKISNSWKERFKRMIIPRKSIIVTCIWSDMWKVVININDCLTNQQINSLIVNEEHDINFVYYKLKNSYSIFKSLADWWSTMPILNKSTFESISLSIPPLPEQQAIASILSSFDDKTELLKEQNKTLETMAQTIFKEWFGKYSVGDELPEGWRVGKLWLEFDISIWRTPPRLETQWFSTNSKDVKWISIKDIWNSWTYIFETSEYLTQEAIKKFNIPLIPENTTILSFKMTVWKLSITTEKMLSNEAIAHLKIKNNSNISSEFIYCYLQNLDFNSLWSTSSIVTAINSTMIKDLEIVIPENKILNNFNDAIKPIFEKIKINSLEIQSLSKTRDELLPKLMSGKVRVV